MNQKKIGSFLKELRKEMGITQEEFAEKLDVSSRTISRWETGANMPDISLLVNIAEIFNVKSEIYKNIPLSQLCLSARVVSAIIRFKNIIDLEKLLNLTLPQIWGIKNLGEIGINELVLLIQKYINDHTPKTKNSVQKPTNEEIQNLLNAIHSQGRSVREVTELLEKNII